VKTDPPPPGRSSSPRDRRAASSTPAPPCCGRRSRAAAPARRRSIPPGRLRLWSNTALLCTLALAVAGPAAAQFGGSLALQSNYQLRGYSLSAGRPVAILNLAYDDPSGIYFNESTIGLLDSQDASVLGEIGNIGYARRLKPSLSLDGGLTHSEYLDKYRSPKTKAYTEAYFGFFAHNLSSHIYYSPDYFAHGVSTIYGEVDAFARPVPGIRLSAHTGYLDYVSEPSGARRRNNQYDWRLSASHPISRFNLSASVTDGGPSPDYYDHQAHRKTAFILGATWNF
jgi:uncharacterized protein (TIGR02001 family)